MAGIAGLKSLDIPLKNPSADLLRDWIEGNTFVWLVTDEILVEYKQVLARLGVRRPVIVKVINFIREEAEFTAVSALPDISPDPGDDPFCACAETGHADFIVTLNPKDFPQPLLSARVIRPGESIATTARPTQRHQSERNSCLTRVINQRGIVGEFRGTRPLLPSTLL